MKCKLATAFLAASLLSTPVAAETVDIATVKCSELATMSEEDTTFMFVWILGYVGGQNGSTTMDLSEMANMGKEIGEHCAANPNVGLLSAAMETLGDD